MERYMSKKTEKQEEGLDDEKSQYFLSMKLQIQSK